MQTSQSFSNSLLELEVGGSKMITQRATLIMQGTYRNSVGGDFADDEETPSFGGLSAGFR